MPLSSIFVMRYIVSSLEHGLTLLSFLQKKGGGLYSGKKLKQAIARKACLVGGMIEAFSSRKLSVGEVVEIDFSSLQEEKETMQILYQDEEFIIVNTNR